MTLQTDKANTTSTATVSADQFYEAILASNPFARSRISDPSQMECDVRVIHADQFDRMRDMADEVLCNGRGEGLLLLGGPGVGKSHLLGRMARWAKSVKACFVSLHNIQPEPGYVGRYLLKCCISRLAEDREDRLDETPLFRIVNQAIQLTFKNAKIVMDSKDNWNEDYEKLAAELGSYEAIFDEVVFDVIVRFYYFVSQAKETSDPDEKRRFSELSTLAVRWLKGDLLDKSDAARLKQLVPEEKENIGLREDQIEKVLLNIALLARKSRLPFIICIDQIENMGHGLLRSLCNVLHSLIDKAKNLLVIVAGVQQDVLERIKDGTITSAAADRLNVQHPVQLHRLQRSEARELLTERIHDFIHRLHLAEECKPYFQIGDQFADGGRLHLPEECKPYFQDDALFPLGEPWFKQLDSDAIEIRARDTVVWAGERWRQIQKRIANEGGPAWLETWRQDGGPAWLETWRQDTVKERPRTPTAEQVQTAIDQKVADKLIESVNGRRLLPGQLPADAGNMRGLTVELLEQCLRHNGDYTLTGVTPRGKREVDLIVHQSLDAKVIVNHVQFVVTASKTSAAAHLRKLRAGEGAHHRILVTEARCPLALGAKGMEYLAELKNLGPEVFDHVHLTFDDYAELDALTAVVGQARSQDLEIEPVSGHSVTVTDDQVIDSYHRNDRYRKHRLLNVFLTKNGTGYGDPPKKCPFDPAERFRQHVMAKLSFLTGANMIELIKSFLALQPTSPPAEDCIESATKVILMMHDEELVCAKPWDKDFYVTLGSKA